MSARTSWLIVTGDLVPTGGQDVANLRLAEFLARADEVHVVAHRVDAALAARPGVHVHLVRRPLGSDALGERVLARAGRREARRLASGGAHVIGNGGCLEGADVNWVHCVHAARTPTPVGGLLRRWKSCWVHRRSIRSERRALLAARVVVCNSLRTVRDVVELVGVARERVHLVYLGVSPGTYGPVTPDERVGARRALGWSDRPARRVALFVGTLGDRGKGFDVLYAAWRVLCADPSWDVDLAVVGVGADRRYFERRLVTDGMAGRIEFLGFRADVPRVLAAVDVMVHPARYDAYGLAVHEALCRGVPAIVSGAAGVSERLTPGESDWVLSDPEDVGALVGRLRTWSRESSAWAARAGALGDRLRAWTWDDMAREIRRLALA